MKISTVEEAVANAILDLEITKDEYAQVCRSEKKRQKGTKVRVHPLPPSP